MAYELETGGVYVVRDTIFSDPCHRADVLEAASNFPEFRGGVKKFVMGGFGALGNPASFHNPVVREHREWAMAILVDKVFRGLVSKLPGGGWKLEQLIGRLTIRAPGESPSRESWHRDEAKVSTDPSDQIYGGWINLDPHPQYFSCVVGSHTAGTAANSGFVKVSEEEAAVIKQNNLSTKVEIPPGAILIFNENIIIHEVYPKKLGYPLVRLHLAWRLTRGASCMRPGLQSLLDSQAIIPIKSGQIPPMHAKLHWVSQSFFCFFRKFGYVCDIC